MGLYSKTWNYLKNGNNTYKSKDEEIRVLRGAIEHLIKAAASLHKAGVEPDPDFATEEWWQKVANCGIRLTHLKKEE